MDEPELSFRSFIIRIWWEEDGQGASQHWEGYITDVASGDRRHVKNLDEIIAFIRHYLEDMGVKLGRVNPIARFLHRV